MDDCVYVELDITEPNVCQVSDFSRERTTTVAAVDRASTPNGNGQITEELTVPSEGLADDEHPNYDDGATSVVQLRRAANQGCACEVIERNDCPVRSIRADNGHLVVSFFAPSVDVLKEIISDLRKQSAHVSLQRLSSPDVVPTESGDDLTKRVLTDRQLEVLQTAYEMGYLTHPKDANAEEVASALDISTTTFSEHISRALTKLIDQVVEYPSESISSGK